MYNFTESNVFHKYMMHFLFVYISGEIARDEKWQRARRNTIKTLALVALCFVICWSSNQIYYFMFNLGYPEEYSSNFYHFTVLMVFLNCCVNPIIYFFKYQEFQLAARRILRFNRSAAVTEESSVK